MVFRDERHEQTPRGWFSRFTRGRRPSVTEAETLFDNTIEEEELWQEAFDAGEAVDTSLERGDATLVPPRLSLQSRVLPAIRPDRTNQPVTGAMNMMKSSADRSGPAQGWPRSSGTLRNTSKIRLETTPMGALSQSLEQATNQLEALRDSLGPSSRPEGNVELHTDEHHFSLTPSPAYENRARNHFSVMDRQGEEETRDPLSGSGIFAGGQNEITVVNERITASSVVMVMLKQNPGPVVVHYITLQPQQSFTIHLTAAVAAPTAFNYIIFPGE